MRVDGFKTNKVYYQDTDSLYIEKKYWDKLNKANYVGDEMGQRKNIYGDGGIFYALFLAPKIKYFSTSNEYGISREKKKFKGYQDVVSALEKKLLDPQSGMTVKHELPLSWKKSFSSGVIPTRIVNCEKSVKSVDKICNTCRKRTEQTREYKFNIKEFK